MRAMVTYGCMRLGSLKILRPPPVALVESWHDQVDPQTFGFRAAVCQRGRACTRWEMAKTEVGVLRLTPRAAGRAGRAQG